MELDRALNDIREEYLTARGKFGPFCNGHEGFAVIKEELDELWDEIKGPQRNENLKEEATQVAAMAVKFLVDLIPVDLGAQEAESER
jgi:hypothetical protein